MMSARSLFLITIIIKINDKLWNRKVFECFLKTVKIRCWASRPKKNIVLQNKYGLLPLLLMWILFLVIQSKNPKNFTRFLPVILEKCQ